MKNLLIFKQIEPNLCHVLHVSIHDLGHVTGGQALLPLQTHRVTELELDLPVLGVQSDPIADEILSVLRNEDTSELVLTFSSDPRPYLGGQPRLMRASIGSPGNSSFKHGLHAVEK